MKNILVCALYFIPVLTFSKVSFVIQGIEADEYKIERFIKGIELFKKSVAKDCGVNFDYTVSDYKELEKAKRPFKSDSYLKTYKTQFGPTNFKFFQKSLFDYLDQNGVLKDNNDIVLTLVSDIYGHCGYAFPDIQFEGMKNERVKSKLRNNVLLSLSARDCGSLPRLVAHELSHIFIQDDPPHMCHGRDCPETNILSVFRYVEQTHRPGHMGRRNGGSPFGGPDIFAPTVRKLPSHGLGINSEQCSSIEKTLETSGWL